MVQIFLKGGREVAETFPISFFQGLPFLHLEITFPLAKLCSAFEKKIFLCHHNFMENLILSCLKMNLKIFCKLR